MTTGLPVQSPLPRRLRGWHRQLLVGLTICALAGLGSCGLQRAAAGVSFHALVAALRATPLRALLMALAATTVSYVALFGYDLSGLRYVRARPPLSAALLASFCGYAIGNAVGFGAFSGGAVRYRIYTAAGLSPGQIGRLILFISVAVGIGLATISGLGLVICADRVGSMLGTSPEPLFAAAALLLGLATVFLGFCATRRRSLAIGPINIEPPGPALILTQLALTTTDVLAAAAVLWVLLPPTGIGFFAFAAVFAAALALGILSHIPGGLGVFEVAILYAVGSKAPVSAVAAALVAYRGIYFLLPLFLSTVLLAGFETRCFFGGELGERIARAASRMAPSFLAAATFAVGASLVISGVMPAFTDRLQILALHVPLWAVETAHLLASIAGLVLLFAARGLLHRLDGAWWLALSMTLLSIPFCLVKGLAIVAPTAALLLLAGLIASRREFDRRASLSHPLSAGWFAAIGCVVIGSFWILFFAFRHVEYHPQLWWQFEFDATVSRALRTALGVAILAVVLGVWQLLRPAAGQPNPSSAAERKQAQRIALAQSRPDALLALMGDKSLLFSETEKSFLMFGKHGRTWAALGDPVGPEDEAVELIWRFIELADAHGGRVAFYQVPSTSLPRYLDAGLKVMKIGEEARVALQCFSLAGRARTGLRYALRRGERDGLALELIPAAGVPAIIGELREISDAWLVRHSAAGEKRFSVAAFCPDYLLAQSVVLLREHGRPVAFATVMETEARTEAMVGLMRQRPDISSRCAMEYLFVRLLQHYQSAGYCGFSLGMTPLSGFAANPLASRWHRIARFIWSHSRRIYNFRGLHAFKGKFDPAWESRYLAASGAFGPYLALADIAVLIGGGMRQRVTSRQRRTKLRRHPVSAGLLSLTLVASSIVSWPARALDTGNFGSLHIVRPDGAMKGLVVFFSDAQGWDAETDKIARALAHYGAFVAGIDLPSYFRLEGSQANARCSDAVSAIELISREIQRERGNSTYWTPILAGTGEGGALAAATLAQSPASTIAGAVSLDPTATIKTPLPLCPAKSAPKEAEHGYPYGPWRSLNGFWSVGFDLASDPGGRERIGELKALETPVAIEDVSEDRDPASAMAALLRPHLGKSRGIPGPIAAGPVISGLPLVEMPASPPGPLLAIVISGDGGWRDLDRSIAAKLQSEGVSVIGWDSLRYFWSHKTPDQIARDLGAVIDTYAARWGASKVALIGYSFGAGVLPFAYDRLPPEAKARVVQLSLLGLELAADFEISMMGWLGAPPTKNALPTEPAVSAIDPSMIQCIYGRDEADSLCPSLAHSERTNKLEIIETDGGHHFGGTYDALAERILDGFRRRAG